jgi:hypothetical protein
MLRMVRCILVGKKYFFITQPAGRYNVALVNLDSPTLDTLMPEAPVMDYVFKNYFSYPSHHLHFYQANSRNNHVL